MSTFQRRYSLNGYRGGYFIGCPTNCGKNMINVLLALANHCQIHHASGVGVGAKSLHRNVRIELSLNDCRFEGSLALTQRANVLRVPLFGNNGLPCLRWSANRARLPTSEGAYREAGLNISVMECTFG